MFKNLAPDWVLGLTGEVENFLGCRYAGWDYGLGEVCKVTDASHESSQRFFAVETFSKAGRQELRGCAAGLGQILGGWRHRFKATGVVRM